MLPSSARNEKIILKKVPCSVKEGGIENRGKFSERDKMRDRKTKGEKEKGEI